MENLRNIPYSQANGVDNMATDAAMLRYAGKESDAVWRIYGWNEAAITFGYSQKWQDVQAGLGHYNGACIRRITGGGIVDHRRDLTYALSLPVSHGLYRAQAQAVYKELHQVITEVLGALGFDSVLAPCRENCGKSVQVVVSVCFHAPEPFDIIDRTTGIKQAGAAMKRDRSGLLIQGSLSREALPGLEMEGFREGFGKALGDWLELSDGKAVEIPRSILDKERQRFSSEAWNRKR